jgi:redox-sensitive bicupin YhaK (pirin superfamily)
METIEMMNIIRSDTRGQADHGWLQARHSFSFADYHDPERMGFGSLRVINEDRIAAAQGFGTHPHKDMEIVTYIIDGALEHKDSMGNGSVIRAGDVQRMTAGTGVFHSEFNPSDDDAVHLLQIWILPGKPSLQPGYEERHFSRAEKLNQWCLLGSQDGSDGALTIHQDISLYSAVIESGNELEHEFLGGRQGYLQVVSGALTYDGETLSAGDGATLQNLDKLKVTAIEEAEVLLFDMA